MFIERKIAPIVKYAGKKFPIVSLTGPRQSGKTTLLQNVFPDKPYVTLEDPGTRAYVAADPRDFLNQYPKGVIIDEAQHVPELFSYIQTESDKRNKPGQFILSGSQNFLMNDKISQSLAGRVAVLKLLPFSIDELKATGKLKSNVYANMVYGFYPRLFERNIRPQLFYSSYYETYLTRDFRQLKNLGDLSTFQKFIQLCAGYSGQLVNLSSLANDTGVAVNTVKAWLSLLEASYIIFLLKPYRKSFNKRLVAAPKLYFWDTGLASFFLGIKDWQMLKSSHMRGALFENFVVAEIGKYYFNQGQLPGMYFWRDKTNNEVDCIVENGKKVEAVEIKSGTTLNTDFFKGLLYWKRLSGKSDLNLVYGGASNHMRNGIRILNWESIHDILK